MDIRTASQTDGTVKVITTDGTTLVSDTYAQLSYSGGTTNNGYDAYRYSYVNPRTGKTIGTASEFDPHLESGTLKGLIEHARRQPSANCSRNWAICPKPPQSL